MYNCMPVSDGDEQLFNVLILRETVQDDESVVRTVAVQSYGIFCDFHGRWEETGGVKAGCGHAMSIWYHAGGATSQDGSPARLHQATVVQSDKQGVYIGDDDGRGPIRLVRTGMKQECNGNICSAPHGVKRQHEHDDHPVRPQRQCIDKPLRQSTVRQTEPAWMSTSDTDSDAASYNDWDDPQSYYDEKPPRMTRIRQTGPVWMSKSEADADGASDSDLEDAAFCYY